MVEPKAESPRKNSRRAVRPAVEGSDPHPAESKMTERAKEDRPEPRGDALPQESENDARLLGDKPPHWG